MGNGTPSNDQYVRPHTKWGANIRGKHQDIEPDRFRSLQPTMPGDARAIVVWEGHWDGHREGLVFVYRFDRTHCKAIRRIVRTES